MAAREQCDTGQWGELPVSMKWSAHCCDNVNYLTQTICFAESKVTADLLTCLQQLQ
jgi:hypothetical protein